MAPLKYGEVLTIDYIAITGWTCVADGIAKDIGILLRVGRSDIVLAYTPGLADNPDNFIQNVYRAGNIFITTENKVIWIKPIYSDFPASINGEINSYLPDLITQPMVHRLPLTLG